MLNNYAFPGVTSGQCVVMVGVYVYVYVHVLVVGVCVYVLVVGVCVSIDLQSSHMAYSFL